MLTPQEVLMHAQAIVIPGRKPPAAEGSYECYPCRVIQIGEVGSCDDLNNSLCARHEKAVTKLMKSSFASGNDHPPPQALIEQRRALLTAVIAARERRERSSSMGNESSNFVMWHPSSSSNASSSSSDSDSNSDSAVEDEDMAMLRIGHMPPVVSLPWRGAPRLPTVVESDEEGEPTPRIAAFGSP